MNAHAILEAFRCQAAYRTVSNTAAHSPSFNISILGCPCTRPGMHSSRTEVQNARHHACQNPKASDKNSPTDHLFIVSANSQTSLSGAVTELLSWLASEKPSATQLRLIADELACRRSLLQWRQYFVASSCEELCSRIEQRQSAGTRASRRVMTVFVFTGQSAQWYQMGKDLFDRYSGFRQSVIESENILRELGSSWSLIDQLYTAKLNSRIHEGEIAQPATTAIQIALVDLLASINVHPQTVIGHSSGEIAAAYTTRAISHRTALKVAYHRGSLPKLCKQNIATAGAMLSVGLSESEVLPYIHGIKKGVLSVACLNSPTSSTVSGDEAAISELAEILDIKGVFNKKLKVDAAYHSHHMRHVAEEYNDSLGHLETCQVRDGIAFVSSVTSAKKQTGFASAYWVDNLVSKVRFLDALTEYRRYSLDHNYQQSARHLLVEVGPHSALRGPIRQTYGQDLENFDYVYTPTLERERDGAQTILELAGKMFSHGYPVDLQEACGSKHRRFPRLVPINLPRYRWDHTKRYWHESQLSKEYRKRPYGSHDLLGVRVINSPPDEPRWRQLLSLAGIPWLAEHAIDGLTTFPGAAYLCMAIEALRQITSYDGSSCDATYVLQDISFMKALIVPEPPGKLEIQLSLRFDDRALRRYDFRVYARSADAMWDEYCRGRIMLDPAALSNGNNAGLRSELRKRCQVSCADPWDSAKLYEQLRLNGNAYGPLFASIKKMVLGSFQAVSQVVMPKGEAATPLSSSEPYIIHPATLDSIMHTSLPIYAAHCKAGSIMPVSIEQLQISSDITVKPAKELTAFTELEHPTHTYAVANAIVFDNGALTARPVLAIDGMKILGVSTSKSSVIGAPETRKMGYQVGWAKDVDFADAAASMDIRRAISLREYCSLLQFKHPSVDVLQIGASQGEWADSIIQHFAGDEGSSIKHDVVLEEPEMEENLFNWQPSQNDKAVLRSNNYSERNSLSECGSKRYDLVLVAVEQRTLDKFAERLGPVRGMLKPGGHLLLNVDLSMCDSALVSGLEKRLCRQNLISLTHLWKNDMANGDANALSVYRATGTMPPSSELPVVVVSNERYGDVSSSIGDALRQKGMQCSMDTWDTLHPDSAGTYIFVCDSRELGLCNANATGFGRIQRVLNTISKAVWLISSVEDSCPDTAVLLGLMRTACSEYDQLRAVTFDVQEMLEDCLSQLLQPITDAIFQLTHSDVYTDGSLETEYTFSKGQLLIPRLIPSPELNEILVEADGQQPAVKSPYMNESCPLRLYDKPFYADGEICFEPDDPIFGSVSADEVIVKINAQALGSEMSNLGSTASASAPSRLKLQEFAGTVVTLGEDVEKDYHIRLGDRVYGWCLIRSSCASYSRCKAQQICHVPCGWDMALAAASPSAIMTAYHTLVEIASVRRGQTILMYGNDCPTTRAAVVIARFLGAEVVVSGVATSQRNRLAEIYDLPSSHILEESGIKLNQRLLDILGHVGVDVVLCTSTAPPSDLWACIAAFGTIVQVVNDGAETTLSGGPLVIGRPFTFAAFDLVSTLGQPSRKIEGLLKKAQDMIQKAKPEFPILLQKVSMGSLRDAISTARTKSSAETIILEADNDTQVNVTRDVCDHFHVSGSRMEENATYVVAGGLGDIGRILCRLMASLGAGNIVVLSRRTLQDQERKDLQNEVDAISCNTDLHIISCDISNPNDVIRAAQIIQDHGLPPVRGVIQAATTLDVSTSSWLALWL